jgi:diguanylate cyclase (GGDEF)-like protein
MEPGTLVVVARPEQAREIVPTSVDLLLTDLQQSVEEGIELLWHFALERPELPIVALAERMSGREAGEAIRNGASDYVVKQGDYLRALPLVVEKNLATWRVRRENAQLQQQLRQTLDDLRRKNHELEEAVARLAEAAATDPLTGLSNRRAFNAALERSFEEARRHGQDLSLLMIDLDGFKPFNDTLGHQLGDRLLQAAARLLVANCRRSDVAGRYGGDEFVVLLPQTQAATALRVGQRIASEFASVSQSLRLSHRDGLRVAPLSLSMGLTSLNGGLPMGAEQLLAQADTALYEAKRGGRRRLAEYRPAMQMKPPTSPAQA